MALLVLGSRLMRTSLPATTPTFVSSAETPAMRPRTVTNMPRVIFPEGLNSVLDVPLNRLFL